MKFPMTVLKVVTVWPRVLVSFVLFMVVLALAPPPLALPAVLAVVVLLTVLAMGRLEAPAVELLTGAREASAGEQEVMTAVAAGLDRIGITDLDLLVRRRQKTSTPAVTVLGRRSLVVTPGLVEAIHRGWVSTEEVVALMGQAVAARRARRPRAELAVLVATSPWRAVRTVFAGVGAAFAWLPFVGLAWALRGVVAVICVAQSLAEGRAAIGLLGAAVIALTYAVPAADRALQARTDTAGDQFVVEHGLGGVLAQFLTRYGHPTTLERRQHLERQPPASAPSPATPLATQVMPLTSFSLN